MSDLRAATISDLAGTGPATLTKQTAAKAWFNLNGSGAIAGRASANISSYTDNGTGDYTGNMTSALTDANYSIYGTANNGFGTIYPNDAGTARTTTAFRIQTLNGSGTPTDSTIANAGAVR